MSATNLCTTIDSDRTKQYTAEESQTLYEKATSRSKQPLLRLIIIIRTCSAIMRRYPVKRGARGAIMSDARERVNSLHALLIITRVDRSIIFNIRVGGD